MTSSAGYLSATAVRELFRRGELSPVELVRTLANRIDAAADLNAIAATDLDRCLHDAELAQRRYADGAARPLEGLPVLVKDIIDTAGIATTYGSSMFAGHVPESDAEVVARIRRLGGLILGKSTTHEFAWGITTSSSAVGPTRNPWSKDLVPGGSSGGSAAALAAGLAPLALGTDTSGSVRIPAAFCGVVGLKPGFGTLSTAGVFPLAPSLDHVGLMSRSVEDVRLLWSVLSSNAVRARSRSAGDLTVGVGIEGWGVEIDAEVGAVLAAAVAAIRARGLPAESIQAPRGAADCYRMLGAIVAFEGTATHRRRGLWPARAGQYLPGVRRRLEHATAVTVDDYVAAQRDRSAVIAAMGALWAEVDVLLSPVSGVLPARIGHDADPDSTAAVEFRRRVMSATSLQSVAGLPACTVRAGFTSSGLPVGVQLTARWGNESVLLDVAERLVTATALQDVWPSST